MKTKRKKKLTAAKRLWALRTLWAVRAGDLGPEHSDAQTAIALLGHEAASEALDKSAPPKRIGKSHDVMGAGRRMPGSFEAGRRR